MPRFRFNWSNVPPVLLEHLAKGQDLDGPPSDGLRALYGARPREDFISDNWQHLLDHWLAHDPESAAEIAASLRDRQVGDTAIMDDLAYLRTCRNTSGLRRIVLPVFIAMGESTPDNSEGEQRERHSDTPAAFGGSNRLGATQPRTDDADGQSPSEGSPSGFGGSDRLGSSQSDGRQGFGSRPLPNLDTSNPVDSLRSWLVDSVKAITSLDVSVDDDGDIPVPFGSALLYVSPRKQPLHVEIFSQLVKDVDASPELLATLNRFNSSLPFARLFHHDGIGGVLLSIHLDARGLGVEALNQHLTAAARLADHYDTAITEQFGGTIHGRDRKSDEQQL